MATNFSATVGEWAKKTQKRLDVVVQEATKDMIIDASRTTTGITRGGDYKRGYVPRDLGNLAGSLVSSLNGGGVTTGETSYTAVIEGMKAGDTAFFGWTAEYALRLHYGFSGEDSLGRSYDQSGWYWVTDAVVNWQDYVDGAVRKAKAAVG